MLVNVIDAEGNHAFANATFLKYLIETGKITAFKGSRGWVDVTRKQPSPL